jgi:Organic solute transporter Ostalpha
MRIAGLIPLYSIFSFLSICFPDAFVYLAPWIDLFQAIALGSFFLLMCEFVSPSSEQRDIFFAALVVPGKKGATAAEHGIPWYRVRTYHLCSNLTVLADLTVRKNGL